MSPNLADPSGSWRCGPGPARPGRQAGPQGAGPRRAWVCTVGGTPRPRPLLSFARRPGTHPPAIRSTSKSSPRRIWAPSVCQESGRALDCCDLLERRTYLSSLTRLLPVHNANKQSIWYQHPGVTDRTPSALCAAMPSVSGFCSARTHPPSLISPLHHPILSLEVSARALWVCALPFPPRISAFSKNKVIFFQNHSTMITSGN